ncbi:MAG: hypothetical protein MI975_06395 [Cytophagales bacterium]|nr:hypothetical protein [Cytophagales bacterium]
MKKHRIRFFIALLMIEFGTIGLTEKVNSNFHHSHGTGVLLANPNDADDIKQPPDPILHSPLPLGTP